MARVGADVRAGALLLEVEEPRRIPGLEHAAESGSLRPLTLFPDPESRVGRLDRFPELLRPRRNRAPMPGYLSAPVSSPLSSIIVADDTDALLSLPFQPCRPLSLLSSGFSTARPVRASGRGGGPPANSSSVRERRREGSEETEFLRRGARLLRIRLMVDIQLATAMAPISNFRLQPSGAQVFKR